MGNQIAISKRSLAYAKMQCGVDVWKKRLIRFGFGRNTRVHMSRFSWISSGNMCEVTRCGRGINGCASRLHGSREKKWESLRIGWDWGCALVIHYRGPWEIQVDDRMGMASLGTCNPVELMALLRYVPHHRPGPRDFRISCGARLQDSSRCTQIHREIRQLSTHGDCWRYRGQLL